MLASHKRSPSISYPIPLTDFPSPHTSPTQPSMSIKSHRGRRPSLPSPMSWLTRASSTGSNMHPVRVSHTKSSSVGTIRHANLGTAVTIVRTPQEALAGSGVSVDGSSDQENDHGEVVARNRLVEEDEEEAEEEEEEGEEEIRSEPADQTDSHHHAEQTENISVPPAYSPPRSSLPLSKSTPSLPLKDPHPHPRPTRAQPHPPTASDTQKKLPPPPLSTLFPAVPPISAHLPSPCSPPPFDCILLSPAPPSAIDFSKLLVTLETCTATHRTTFGTLTSRPSRLASYLKSLFSDIDEESDPEAPSLSSPGENGSFHSIFHNHLASSGLLSPSAFNIHVFLDRASPSYDHILAYLRSPPSTTDHAATLPHAVQLHAATPARLEALLALRDEAVYLDLPELALLCATELRRYPNFHAAQLSRTTSTSTTSSHVHHHVHAHARGQSTSSSMRSMDTLREHDEDNAGAGADVADVASTSTGRDSFGSSKSAGSARSRGRTRNVSTTPAGAAPAPAPAPAPIAKEKEEPSSHPTPAPLLHRRLASQSRERPELMDIKSATIRGRPSGTWV